MKIQENFSLKNYNTFGVKAKAKYFAEVHSLEELKETLQFSYSPILVLGGGSNVLFTKDFEGMVIKLNLKGISEEVLNENHVLVTAKAGKTGMNLYSTRFLKIMAD